MNALFVGKLLALKYCTLIHVEIRPFKLLLFYSTKLYSTMLRMLLKGVIAITIFHVVRSAKITRKGEGISAFWDQEIIAATDVSGNSNIKPPSDSDGASRLFLSPSPSPSPIPVPCSQLLLGKTSKKFDGEIDSTKCFYMDVQKSGTYIIKTTGSGDLDIYAGPRFYPTQNCFGVSDSATEECPVYAPKNEKLFVEVYGYKNYTYADVSIDFYLEKTIPKECKELKSEQQNLSFKIIYDKDGDFYYYEQLCYFVEIPKNAKSYTASTSGSGDVDLRTGVGYHPTWDSFTCISDSFTSDEECSGNVDGVDKLFLVLDAYNESNNATLSIDFQSKPGKAYKFSPLKESISKAIDKNGKRRTSVDNKMRRALKRK